jgi:excisionase family DNA binding protein
VTCGLAGCAGVREPPAVSDFRARLDAALAGLPPEVALRVREQVLLVVEEWSERITTLEEDVAAEIADVHGQIDALAAQLDALQAVVEELVVDDTHGERLGEAMQRLRATVATLGRANELPDDADALYDVRQACSFLGVPRARLYELLEDGEIAYESVNGVKRVRRAALVEYARKRAQ